MFVSTERRVAVGLHHAKAELRGYDKQHHRDMLLDMIEGADYPNLVMGEIARRLGRERSLEIELPKAFVDAAVRMPKVFEGRL